MNRTHIGLGVFVLGTLGLLVWLAQSIGAIGSRGGIRYEVRLEHAAGLVTNNAVKIAGVEVGHIEAVGVDHDIAVLTLHRGTAVIPNPRGDRVIEVDDRLLCFGNLEAMRGLVPERRRRNRLKVQPLPDEPLPETQS